MSHSPTDPIISEFYRKIAKQRKDNKRGFNDPEVVRKAIETRRKNREKKNQSSQEKS
jgi:hypothetical protein